MGMYEQALAEKARREKSNRAEALTGTPNIIQEQHEGVSFKDRLLLKNLGKDANANAQYLAKNNPQLDTRVWDGQVLVKGKNEKDWKTLDPDTGFFSDPAEFGKDVLDIGYDVGSGIVEGVGTAAGAVGGAIFGGGGGSIPAAMLTNAALSGASEATRQNLGSAFGIEDNVDYGDVATTAALGGIIPMVPAAAMKAAGMAKAPVKGALKFLGGVDEKKIQAMTRAGAEEIEQVEADTIVPYIQELAKKMGGAINEADARNVAKIKEIKSRYNISSDEDFIKIIKAEMDVEPDLTKVKDFQKLLNSIEETAPIRNVIDRVGMESKEDLAREAFPGIKGLAQSARDISVEAGEKLKGELKVINKQFEDSLRGSTDVSLESAKPFWDEAIQKIKSSGLGRDKEESAIAAIRSNFDETFKRINPNYSPEGAQRDLITGQMLGGDKYTTDVAKITTGKSGKTSSIYTANKINKADQYLELDTVSPEGARVIKSDMGAAAGFAKRANLDNASQIKLYDMIAKINTKASFAIEEAMDNASGGIKGTVNPKRVEWGELSEISDSLFKTPKLVAKTIKGASKNTPEGELIRDQITGIDNYLGTNYGEVVESVIKSTKATKKGIKAGKAFGKAKVLTNKLAGDAMSESDKTLMGLKKEIVGNNDVESSQKTQALLKKYASGDDAVTNKSIDDIADKFSTETANDVKDLIRKIDLASVYGDSEKTLIKEASGEQASNAARGALQAFTWQTGLGAGAAQVGGAIGKSLGAQVPIRKALRKYLPAYFEGKGWAKGKSDSFKKELEKTIGDTVIRRKDLIRELSKKLGTVDEN